MQSNTEVRKVGGPSNRLQFTDWEGVVMDVEDGLLAHGDETGNLYVRVGAKTADLDQAAQGELVVHIIKHLGRLAQEQIQELGPQASVATQALVRISGELEAATNALFATYVEGIVGPGDRIDPEGLEGPVDGQPREVDPVEVILDRAWRAPNPD